MILAEFAAIFRSMVLEVFSALPITVPFILGLWTATLLREKRRLPLKVTDFSEFRGDVGEFAIMNALVVAIFLVQIITVGMIIALM